MEKGSDRKSCAATFWFATIRDSFLIFEETIPPMKYILLPLSLLLVLGGASALAQTTPPVLNAPPAPPAATIPATAVSNAPDTYLLGRVYRVETQQGTAFTGTLVSISLKALEFDANELGHITLERSQIRQADLQGPRSATVVPGKAGYYDIGNGNRLFFAPTGRGLRKGEGTLQDAELYLVGVNYGITDNLSLGGYVSIFPFQPLDQQFLMLTPKLSYPISDKLHMGFGLLYIRVPTFESSGSATTAGIGYGVLTYGSADDNLTVGLGYGFVEGEIGSTPTIQLGGQKRLSRRISLVSENFIIAKSEAGMGGLYGLKFNWRRTNLGVAGAYFGRFAHDEQQPSGYNPNTGQYSNTTQTVHVASEFRSSYIIPLYVDFTFRFGSFSGK